MLELNLLDETFDRNQSHNYHLSIQTSSNGISICVLDTVRNKYIGLRHHRLADSLDWNDGSLLKNIVESDDLLKLSYKSVSNLLVEAENTIVPLAFFEDAKKEAVFQLNHQIPPSAKIISNTLTQAAAINIFSSSNGLSKTLNTLFPKIKTFQRATPFIEQMVHESAKWARPKCYVLINNHSVDIGLAQLKKLEFYNSFDYKENSDIVYFILSVLEQFKLSAMYTDVYVSVDKENHHELFDFLNNYLNMIRFIRPSELFTYSYIFDELQLTRFANLFNLALCE